jgi:hypothetical protein
VIFEDGINTFLLLGYILYSTKEDNKFWFFLIGWGLMFFNNNNLDYLISFDLLCPYFYLYACCWFYDFSFLFVSILNYFYILSILAISIKAIFLWRFIFYNFILLTLFVVNIGLIEDMRSLIIGNFTSGECLFARGSFILSIRIIRIVINIFII